MKNECHIFVFHGTRFPLADKVEAMLLRAIAEGFGSRMT
jgi:hypothetical protein